ncbi:MAG: CvpA family protein [Verrucomicrobiia bacterium]
MKDLITNICWFDLLVVILISLGIFRGRKRGMSQELLDLLMWIGIVVGGALGYKFVSQIIIKQTGLELFWSNLLGYLAIVLICMIVKSILDRLVHDKIIELDLFGGLEYPLGMLSGAIRFLLILIMLLSLLNAKLVPEAELQAELKEQEKELGAVYFPSIGQIQRYIFEKSLSGRQLKKHLSFLLIEAVAPEGNAKKSGMESIKKEKQKQLDSVIGK